MWWDL